jgi:hypothetical protein
MTIFWIDDDGAIVKSTDDSATDDTLTGIKVPPSPAPESGEQTWLGSAWSSAPDRSASSIAKKDIAKSAMLGGVVTAIAKRLEITEQTLIDEIAAEVAVKKA